MAKETGLLGDVLDYLQDPNRTQQVQGLGGLLQSSISNMEQSRNKWRKLNDRAFADKKNPAKITDQAAFDELVNMTMSGPMSFAPAGITKKMATVMNPERIAFPDIYKNPRELVQEATSRVATENPLMKQLFGVTRQDLFDISQQGTRPGNITDVPFRTAANPKGAKHAPQVMNPRNVQRLQDIVAEAKQQPELYKGMASWYTMDPLYQRFVDIYGADKAIGEYNKFNALTGMSSPGSEVLTELNRGTAANMMDTMGRFEDFRQFGGVSEKRRGKDFPPELAGVIGHPYHSTAQAGPMGKYLAGGLLDMDSAKVPSYIHASGVPDTGFQTQWPVGDAHWSRLVG